MAAKEVIHFPLRAQLSPRLRSTALRPPEPVAKSPPSSENPKTRVRRSSPWCACRPRALAENRKGRTVRTEIYTELYLWNKNVDSLLRVLQRLEALRILSGPSLKECEIRLEELRSVFNVRILEMMLTREQTDHWRFSGQREALDDPGRNDVLQ